MGRVLQYAMRSLSDYRPKVMEDYLVEGLDRIFVKFGRPPWDNKSLVSWNMLGQIIQVWMKSYPKEFDDWIKDVRLDLSVERSLKESVKGGFKKAIGFPPRLLAMIKLYFPEIKVQNKKFIRKCIKTFPMLHNSNFT